MTGEARNRRWVWLGLVVVIVAVGAGTFFWSTHRSQDVPIDNKSALVDVCLKKANDAALQHGTSYNEEQKRILQQICGCVADQTVQQLTPQEKSAFAANPNDPTILQRMASNMQGCAATAKMPANSP